jgi:hypothetical protein
VPAVKNSLFGLWRCAIRFTYFSTLSFSCVGHPLWHGPPSWENRMIIVFVATFMLGIAPAYTCLLWVMKRLSEEERHLAGPQRYFDTKIYSNDQLTGFR